MEQMNLEQVYFAQCEIELLVYKLCNNKRRPEALKEYTGYTKRTDIPAECITPLKKELESELRCKEILGTEKYENSRTLSGKMLLYERIFARARRILHAEEWDEKMSWREFRRRLAVEMKKLPEEAQEKTELWALGAEQLDESGCRWGRPDDTPARIMVSEKVPQK